MRCPVCGLENEGKNLNCSICGAVLEKSKKPVEKSVEKEGQGQKSAPEVSLDAFPTVKFGRRLVAYLIDFAVITLFFALLVAAGMKEIPDFLAQTVMGLYFVILWVFWEGRTVGKKIMKIKIVTIEGKPITPGKAVLRYLGYILSSLGAFLGFLWIIWDKNHQGWHDKIAKTLVVKE